MPNQRAKPTLRRRRLGGLLRDSRIKSGQTLEAAAAHMGWDHTKLSKIEHARAHIAPRDIAPLMNGYGVTDEVVISALEALAKDAGRRGWWATYGDVAASGYTDLISLEADADSVRFYSPTLVPGLLQTGGYARQIIAATAVTRSTEEVEALAGIRIARQSVLSRLGKPLKLRVVIDEAALRHKFPGAADVMREQMTRLLDVSTNPNVIIQIMPLGAGPHPGLAGMFSIVGFQHPWPTVVHVESIRGASFVEGTDDVVIFENGFDRITAAALPVDESREVMKKIMEETKA
ncbi:helix-turn-helix domain-containing protein [Streptomyces katsurahamanus]|uniref:Helix-turn-helix domain-containing protein n=1 Tax=Streptomyces katsurahamanus TaxID=2577098 RepID=A0ABW9P1H2_9ACTN|nr:helix-turn-helix transcriptional regulator [Streptomyces katsurahamanus]MQS39355.1 helix-turn-helix domain-containing protein [Streptomyces katsurahamanus]